MRFLKEHRKLAIAVAAIVVVCALLLSYVSRTAISASVSGPLYGESSLAEKEDRAFTDSPNAPEGMKLAAGNSAFELYVNPENAEFAVLDKRNNKLWYSNPPDADNDPIAVGDMKSRLKSQLFVEYYNSKNQNKSMNSYFYSILEKGFEIEPIKSGFRTVYTIGKKQFTREMLPQVVEKERFESLILNVLEDGTLKDMISRRYKLMVISKLDSFKQKQYSEAYPALDWDKEYYILDLYAPIYEFEDIYNAIFEQTDYTMEDFERDNAANGIEAEQVELELLTIPLEVTIDDNGLNVNIPVSAVKVPDNIFIRRLHVLEYFGAGSTEDQGYMIVPDGCGSLVYFNNGKIDAPPYETMVYGMDKAIKVKDANVRYPKTALPVFAEKNGDGGFLAIITEGDAHASIHAEVSGYNTSYNHVYSSYNILPVDFMSVSAGENPVITNKYQQEMYQGNIRISYRFVGEEDSDYSSLASLYRSYLIEKGILKADGSADTPFVVELLGRVETEKSIMGIHYTSYEVLTSFAQGSEIIQKLKENGVTAPIVKYTSWFSGRSQQTMTSRSGFAPGMGGRIEFDRLAELLGNGNLYLNTSLLNVHQGLLDFNYILYGIRHTYNEIVGIRPFNIATNIPDTKQSKYYLLSPRYVKDQLGDIANRLSGLGATSIWLDDMGSDLFSDFSKGENIDRQESIKLIQAALEGLSDKKIGFDSPNQYVFSYASHAVNVPLTSSGHRLEDEMVPFVQIVLSGSMGYTGPVINLSGKATDDMLKAVETGSGLHFKWIYADNTLIRELDGPEPQKIYSLNYEEWIGQAGSFYKRMVEDMAGLIGEPIIGHERIGDNVYKTTWENGSVIVNYNDHSVTVGGKTIAAKDYLVVKGER